MPEGDRYRHRLPEDHGEEPVPLGWGASGKEGNPGLAQEFFLVNDDNLETHWHVGYE